jgi:hypothetical protein
MGEASFPVVDAAGNLRHMAHEESDSGRRTPRYVLEVAGKAVSEDNPLHVTLPEGSISAVSAGSTGYDYSANGLTAPPGVLIATVPVNPDRLSVEVQNQWPADITMIRDDGANGQRTAVVLHAAEYVGGPGGAWDSSTFRGRLRFYGPADARVSISED